MLEEIMSMVGCVERKECGTFFRRDFSGRVFGIGGAAAGLYAAHFRGQAGDLLGVGDRTSQAQHHYVPSTHYQTSNPCRFIPGCIMSLPAEAPAPRYKGVQAFSICPSIPKTQRGLVPPVWRWVPCCGDFCGSGCSSGSCSGGSTPFSIFIEGPI